MKIIMSALIVGCLVATAFGASAVDNMKQIVAERHAKLGGLK